MFDSLFEALFKNQGPEMVNAVSDILKTRELCVEEAASAENAVFQLTESEYIRQSAQERVAHIAQVSDVMIGADVITPIEKNDKSVDDIVEEMTTGHAIDEIDIHAPERINPVLFENMTHSEEVRELAAQATSARVEIERIRNGIPKESIDMFEALPSEPYVADVTASVEETEKPELASIRAKLDALYNTSTSKITNDEFGLAA